MAQNRLENTTEQIKQQNYATHINNISLTVNHKYKNQNINMKWQKNNSNMNLKQSQFMLLDFQKGK